MGWSQDGLEYLGQRFSKKSAAVLTQRGHALGLHSGVLKDVRAEWSELSTTKKALRQIAFGLGGLVGMLCFRGFGKGEFDSEKLRKLVEDTRQQGRALITVSNHVGTIDDPVLWGALPWWWVVSDHRNKRWIWATQEICHTNFVTAFGFGCGQNIPVVRGAGLGQPAMAELQAKVDNSRWCHVFSEAMCNQSGVLQPFRWGVGCLACNAKEPPVIVPMAHSGMENMFPEAKTKAYPRFSKVKVLVGDPVHIDDLWHAYQKAHTEYRASNPEPLPEHEHPPHAKRYYAEVTVRTEAAVRNLYQQLYPPDSLSSS
ncbi:putative lysophosphatidylcholine acyltransferase [Diplonema papillatum]|nr:putative lysophosphatidylcholine acyltransferase [Diplonema papillatum]